MIWIGWMFLFIFIIAVAIIMATNVRKKPTGVVQNQEEPEQVEDVFQLRNFQQFQELQEIIRNQVVEEVVQQPVGEMFIEEMLQLFAQKGIDVRSFQLLLQKYQDSSRYLREYIFEFNDLFETKLDQVSGDNGQLITNWKRMPVEMIESDIKFVDINKFLVWVRTLQQQDHIFLKEKFYAKSVFMPKVIQHIRKCTKLNKDWEQHMKVAQLVQDLLLTSVGYKRWLHYFELFMRSVCALDSVSNMCDKLIQFDRKFEIECDYFTNLSNKMADIYIELNYVGGNDDRILTAQYVSKNKFNCRCTLGLHLMKNYVKKWDKSKILKSVKMGRSRDGVCSAITIEHEYQTVDQSTKEMNYQSMVRHLDLLAQDIFYEKTGAQSGASSKFVLLGEFAEYFKNLDSRIIGGSSDIQITLNNINYIYDQYENTIPTMKTMDLSRDIDVVVEMLVEQVYALEEKAKTSQQFTMMKMDQKMFDTFKQIYAFYVQNIGELGQTNVVDIHQELQGAYFD